jgi:hypothetical protein
MRIHLSLHNAALGRHGVKSFVVRARRHFVQFLRGVCHTQPVPPRQAGERPVVVAGAVPDSVAAPIERQERHQQEVGLPDHTVGPKRAETLRNQHIARTPKTKDQWVATFRCFRQHDRMPSLVQCQKKRPDIDLLSDRPEPGHRRSRRGRCFAQHVLRQRCAACRVPRFPRGQHPRAHRALGFDQFDR